MRCSSMQAMPSQMGQGQDRTAGPALLLVRDRRGAPHGRARRAGRNAGPQAPADQYPAGPARGHREPDAARPGNPREERRDRRCVHRQRRRTPRRDRRRGTGSGPSRRHPAHRVGRGLDHPAAAAPGVRRHRGDLGGASPPVRRPHPRCRAGGARGAARWFRLRRPRNGRQQRIAGRRDEQAWTTRGGGPRGDRRLLGTGRLRLRFGRAALCGRGLRASESLFRRRCAECRCPEWCPVRPIRPSVGVGRPAAAAWCRARRGRWPSQRRTTCRPGAVRRPRVRRAAACGSRRRAATRGP